MKYFLNNFENSIKQSDPDVKIKKYVLRLILQSFWHTGYL